MAKIMQRVEIGLRWIGYVRSIVWLIASLTASGGIALMYAIGFLNSHPALVVFLLMWLGSFILLAFLPTLSRRILGVQAARLQESAKMPISTDPRMIRKAKVDMIGGLIIKGRDIANKAKVASQPHEVGVWFSEYNAWAREAIIRVTGLKNGSAIAKYLDDANLFTVTYKGVPPLLWKEFSELDRRIKNLYVLLENPETYLD